MVYRASALRGLAITQMVLGALLFVFGFASILAVPDKTSYTAYGIWIGVWVIVSGVVGYVGARNNSMPNKCLIGCSMGFSITACLLTAIMIFFYGGILNRFAGMLRCKKPYYSECVSEKETARKGVGLGSCLVIFAVVELFVALASSIYCCKAVCCSSTGALGSHEVTQTQTQQVMFVPAQQMYQGGQAGMVVIQPSGQITTMPTNYPAAGQQAMFVSQQPMQQMQLAYWAPTSVPAGAVPVSYATSGGIMQTQGAPAQQPYKNQEMPPPYSTGGVAMAPVTNPPGGHSTFNV